MMRRNTVLLGLRERLPNYTRPDSDPFWALLAWAKSKPSIALSGREVPTLDCERRTIWIADAHRGDGKRFVVRADEKMTAFWNLNWRPALAASCVDRLAFFFQNWPSLNSCKSDAGSFPREVLR